MSRYHFNKETGRANICRATKKGCPLGADTPHFDSKEDAKAYIEKIAAAEHDQMLTTNKKKREEQNAKIFEEYQKTHTYDVDVHSAKDVIKILKDPIGNPEKMDNIAQKIRNGDVPPEVMDVITERKPISHKLQAAIMESPYTSFQNKAEVHNSNYSITPEYINKGSISEIREMYPYFNKENKAVALRYTNDEKLFNAAVRVLSREHNNETKRWIVVNAYQNSNITWDQKQKLAQLDSSAASLVKMETINPNLNELYHNIVREKPYGYKTTELDLNNNYIKENNLSQFDVNVLLNHMHDTWKGEITKLKTNKKYIYDMDSVKYYQS